MRILAVLLALAGSPAALGQPTAPTEDGLFTRLAARLLEIMESPRRLEPIPRAVLALDVSPGATAVARVDFAHLTGRTPERLRIEAVGEDVMRILHGGRVVGSTRDGEFLLALSGAALDEDAPNGAVLAGDAVHPIRIPPGIVRAHRADRWYAVTSGSLLYALGDGAPSQLAEGLPRARLTSAADRRQLVLAGLDRSTRPATLRCVFASGGEAILESHTSRILGNDPVVLPGDDGPLLVGDRIMPLARLADAMPREDVLAGFIDAAAAGDEAAVRELLPIVTSFAADTTRGLITNLRALPDDSGAIRGTLLWLANVQREGQRHLDDGSEARPQLETHVRAVLAEAARVERALADELEAGHAFSPAVLADRLSRGAQFVDGRWILPPAGPLLVDSTRAFVRVGVQTPGETTVWGLAIVGADGSLQPVRLERDRMRWRRRGSTFVTPTSAVLDQHGELLLFVKSEGLAQLRGDTPEWLDRSDAIRAMDRLVGCDQHGTLYFQQRSSMDGRQWTFRYRPGGEPDATTRARVLDVAGSRSAPLAALDDLDRLWFVAPHGHESPGTFRDAPMAASGEVVRHEDVLPLRRRAGASTLFRLDDDGTLHRFFSDDSLLRAWLLPGVDGALTVVTDRAVYLVDGGDVFVGDDLDALARRHGDTLLRLAPRRVEATTEDRWIEAPPVVLATDDRLWVAHGDVIDVFLAGAPESLAERIRLRSGPFQAAFLAGPISHDGGTHLLVSVVHGTGPSHFWASVGADGIDLSPIAAQVEYEPGHVQEVTTYLSRPPIADARWHRLLFSAGHRVLATSGPGRYSLFPAQGRARFATGDGRIVLEHEGRPDRYSVLEEGRQADLEAVWLSDLTPVADAPDGRLACLGWNGITWIGRDDDGIWRVDESVRADLPERPTRLIGATARAWYVACGRTRVARIERP